MSELPEVYNVYGDPVNGETEKLRNAYTAMRARATELETELARLRAENEALKELLGRLADAAQGIAAHTKRYLEEHWTCGHDFCDQGCVNPLTEVMDVIAAARRLLSGEGGAG